MKITLIPVYFDPGRDENFDKHLGIVKDFLKEEADFLAPHALGVHRHAGADTGVVGGQHDHRLADLDLLVSHKGCFT